MLWHPLPPRALPPPKYGLLLFNPPTTRSTVSTITTTTPFWLTALQSSLPGIFPSKKGLRGWRVLGLGGRRNTFWKAAGGPALLTEAPPLPPHSVCSAGSQLSGWRCTYRNNRALEMGLLAPWQIGTDVHQPWDGPQESSLTLKSSASCCLSSPQRD